MGESRNLARSGRIWPPIASIAHSPFWLSGPAPMRYHAAGSAVPGSAARTLQRTAVMARLTSLCVYCGSSSAVDPAHLEAAAALGRLAAERGVQIVFGGGRVGLMGVLADAALAAGGEVVGVIPEHLQVREVGHQGITRLEVVDSMHSRKMRMAALSDAFCTLPGGLGTLDETFEIITWRQLGLHDKPVTILNQGGFWDPLLSLIGHQTAGGYIHNNHHKLFAVVDSVEAVFSTIAAAPEPRQASDIRHM